MGALVHLSALAPAALATCCLVADRGRRRAAELVASAVMLLAMVDTITGSTILPVIAWTAVLLVAGMLLGLGGGRRAAANPADRAMAVHAALGCIVMAASIVLTMAGAGDLAAGSPPGGHHSGSSSAVVTFVAVAGTVCYAAASFAAVGRGRWQQRAQRLGMGASALVMGAAALLS